MGNTNIEVNVRLQSAVSQPARQPVNIINNSTTRLVGNLGSSCQNACRAVESAILLGTSIGRLRGFQAELNGFEQPGLFSNPFAKQLFAFRQMRDLAWLFNRFSPAGKAFHLWQEARALKHPLRHLFENLFNDDRESPRHGLLRSLF